MSNNLFDVVAKITMMGTAVSLYAIQEYNISNHSQLLAKHNNELIKLRKLYQDFKKSNNFPSDDSNKK